MWGALEQQWSGWEDVRNSHPRWVQWLFVGAAGVRSPVSQDHHCSLPQCVIIVGVLGEAVPMKKCGCVSFGETGADGKGALGPPYVGT